MAAGASEVCVASPKRARGLLPSELVSIRLLTPEATTVIRKTVRVDDLPTALRRVFTASRRSRVVYVGDCNLLVHAWPEAFAVHGCDRVSSLREALETALLEAMMFCRHVPAQTASAEVTWVVSDK